jgi:hypothetical protein
VFCKFEDVLPYHPLIHPSFDLPEFLRHYWVVYDTGSSPDVSLPVHSLYHFIFENVHDREALLPALTKGETIAILNPDKSNAISAITFAAAGDSCVILYVATEVYIQNTGMATLLFSLVSVIMRCRLKKNEIWMYLKVNPSENKPTARYYKKKLGFKDMMKKKFPDNLVETFKDEAVDSPLSNYFDSTEKELKWLYKKCIAKESKYNWNPYLKEVKARFFTDPNWMGSPSTYSYLPGTLGLESLNHCAPDFESTSASKLKHHVFSTSSGNNVSSPACDVVHMSWVTRCFTKKNEGCTSDFLQIAISWLKRDPHADIWNKYMTLIPIAVMDAVRLMVYLFQQYRQMTLLHREMMLSTNRQPDGILNHIFHPYIDHKKFMEASSCVMKFILGNTDLFEKPYICMLTCDDVDFIWGSFISFNAGKIATGNKKHDTNDDTESDCGYIQFEPLPVPDNEFERTDSLRQIQYSFFLKLAYHVCHSTPKNSSKVPLNCTWIDDSVAPWFQTMRHFERMFRNEKVNFGYVLDHDMDRNDIAKGRFRTFDLPQGHPALSMPYSTTADTAMASFTFLLEYCTLMKPNHNDPKTNLQEMRFDNVRGHTEECWNSYFFHMQVNLYQLVDRIASYQLGSDVVEFEEYKVCKLGDGRLLKNPQLELYEMAGDKIIPDLSFLNNWVPSLPKQKGKDKKRWGPGEKEAAKRLRKPTFEDTSEEDGLTPRSSKKRKRRTVSTKKRRIETIQPSVPEGLVISPPDDNVNTAESAEENCWEDETSITSVARVPVITLDASVPNVARRPGLTPAVGSSHTDLGMSYPTIPLDGVSSIVSIFKERYDEVKSELEKEILLWEVFKFSHLQNPSTVVSEVLTHIRKCFEVPEPNEEDGGCANEDSDFVEVRVCKKSNHSNFPKSYLKRTAELKVLYEEHIKAGTTSETAYFKMYWILKRERFKFVHQPSGEGGPWSEMCIGPAIQVLKRRFNNLRRVETNTTKVDSKRKNNTKPVEHIDEQAVSLVAQDPPAPTWILGMGNPYYKGSLANKEFRRRMKEYSPQYESLPPLSEERTNALRKFMERLDGDGYQFMDFKDGVWIALEGENKKMRKIRQAFAAHARTNRETVVAKATIPKVANTNSKKKPPRKKKALDVSSSNSPPNVCEIAPNSLGCEKLMPHVPVENQVLPQLERGPQFILPGNKILPETNNEEGGTTSQTEDRSGMEDPTSQRELVSLSNVLANLSKSTQDTYVFHENDDVSWKQGGGVVDLTQPRDENEPYDAHES